MAQMRFRFFSAQFVGMLALQALLCLPQLAAAVNSVVISSQTVRAGEVNVSIPIRLTNDLDLSAIVIPLTFRSASGSAFVTRIQMSYAERLASGGILDNSIRKQYADPDATCKSGGFKTATYSDGASHPVLSSPEGVMFVRLRQFGADLTAGADVGGSMIMSVDIASEPGTFEIDTTCVDPANHLAFVRASDLMTFEPAFSIATFTIRNAIVTNLNDDGPGSLRAAISYANSNPGRDSITFAVNGAINLVDVLPALTDPSGTLILGFTAPGAVYPVHPTVILNGPLPIPGPGLRIASSFNYIDGLKIRNFNGPGVAVTFGSSLSNSIVRCHFYGNTGPAIDLGNDGITANDPGDIDVGPNLLTNFPVFTSVTENPPGTFVLTGVASPLGIIELYLAGLTGDAGLPPGDNKHGPAWLYLASTTAGPSGQFSIGPITQPEWALVTATCTDTSLNTSEFSENKYLAPDPMTFTGYSEPPPPLSLMSNPQVSPALQIKVYSPPDSTGHVDSIGPNFNTFGTSATYDSAVDYNLGGKPDSRVRIASPDTGTYTIKYILIGDPGDYLTGIGIDGHAEVKKAVSFASPAQIITDSYLFSPRLRGELNSDGVIDVFDVIAAIDIVFAGAPTPSPPELIDVNCDGPADVFDVIYLIDYVFAGGPEPCP